MMKKNFLLAISVFVFAVAGGCKFRDYGFGKMHIDEGQIDSEISRKINSFTEKLFQSIYVPEKNMSFSGISVYNLLYIMSNASAGETSGQISKVLELDGTEYDSQMKQVILSIENNSNSVWVDKTLYVKKSFSDFCKKLGTDIFSVNFVDSRTTEKINKFIKKSTKNEIANFLQNDLNPETKLVFLNTLCFNQKWLDPFPKENTIDGDFYLSSDKSDLSDLSVRIKMMHETNAYSYYDNGDFQIIQFDYKNSDCSMIVMLPRKCNCDFSKFALNQLLSDFEKESCFTSVCVSFPKFKSDKKVSLKDILMKFGITDVFSQSADFSNIVDNAQNIYVDEILHETKVSVDEEKTKAAAVSLSMAKSASCEPEVNAVFTADHPFCYVIKDNQSGLILFSGVVNNPNE